MRQRVDVLSAPVTRQSHSILNARQRRTVTARFGITSCSLQELQRELVLTEPLPGAGQGYENLFSRRFSDRRVAIEMFQRAGQIIRRLSVCVFVQCGESGCMQIPDGLARERRRMRSSQACARLRT